MGKEPAVGIAEIKGNKINLSLNDLNEHVDTVATDIDDTQADHQWNDMMAAQGGRHCRS